MFIFITIAGVVLLPIIWAWIEDRIIPRKPSWWGASPHFPQVPRRHLESFKAWEKRRWDALNAFSDAERAIITSPDAVTRQISASGFESSIPTNHPLWLKWLRAKYPDGPTYQELEQIALAKVKAKPDKLVRKLSEAEKSKFQVIDGGKK